MLLDALVSVVPFLGDIFDVFYKANRRNFKLLVEHYHEGKHEGSAVFPVMVAILGILGILLLFVYLVFKFGELIFSTLVGLF